MSIAARNWAWEHATAQGGDLLVLLCLAEHADDRGICYPSVGRIAARTRLSLRGVQKALRSLETQNILKTRPNYGPKGCNLYTLNMLHPEHSSPPHSVQGCTQFTPNVETQTPEHSDRGGEHGDAIPPNTVRPNRKGTVREPSGSSRSVPGESFDAGMVASAVLIECGVAGMRTRMAVEEVARQELAKGAVGQHLAETMAERWREFEAARPKLFTTAGPERFFADGMWRDPTKWPWKPDAQPKVAKRNPPNALELVKQQQERSHV